MSLINKPAKFINDVNHEMSKVSWPSYEDLKESTMVFMVFSLLFVVLFFSPYWLLTIFFSFFVKIDT